jgi:hypothetical protein
MGKKNEHGATSASYKPKKQEPVPSKDGRHVLSIVSEDLSVPLTPDEISEATEDLVNQSTELESHLAIKKETMSGLRAKELAIQARIKHLCIQLKNKTKIVSVQCQNEADVETNKVETIRLDTGTVVRTRALAPSERQTFIPGTEPVVVDGELVKTDITDDLVDPPAKEPDPADGAA